jgi:hypothetical protein
MSTSTTKQNPIALNLPKAVGPLIVFGRHVVLVMTGNTWFPSPSPALATVTTDLDALESSQATALTRAKGSAAARNLKKKTVQVDLKALAAYVSTIAAQNADKATAIILSAGMKPKDYTRPAKAPLAALMGPTPGEILLRAKAVGRGAAYEWQYSPDGKTWVAAGTTTVANTSIQGMTAGTTYQFRFRATLKQVTGNWVQIISFLAH